MENKITLEKINKYLNLTKKAFEIAKNSNCKIELKPYRQDVLQMIEAYISDSEHFLKKDDLINSFAAINYAHGWLDAAARLQIFKVKDSKLFTVDDEN